VSPRLTAALRQTFASAHGSRNFRLYLSGQIVSAVGTWMNFTASSWLVLRLSDGSGTALGLNAALMFGPMLLLGPFGGVLADRRDKRMILAWTQSAFACVALAMGVLVASGNIELWMVYTLSVVAGIVISIDNPSRQSFYVEMVGEGTLTNAVSLNSAAFMMSRVIGPALAGLLIQTTGTAVCFFVDALSYMAVLWALLAMRPGELHEQRRSTRERGHLLAGLRYVWETDELRRPLVLMAAVFTFSFQWQVLAPLLAERAFHAGPGEFGALSAAAGVGALAAALRIANRNPRPTMRLLSLLALGVGVALAAVAFAPTLWIAAILMVPVGFAAMSFMIVGNTGLQLAAKPEARGRVMAIYGVLFLGSTPIGSPVIGWIGEHLGPRVDYLIAGCLAMLLGAGALWARRRVVAAAVAA
jgi:MFS family permease